MGSRSATASSDAAALPPLHLVTDDEVLRDRGFSARARAALEAGGGGVALHLRGPRIAGRVLFELAVALLPAARAAGALLLVNDRVDVALAAGADGVHLGGRSIRVAAARRLVGPERAIGASVHGPAEAAAAAGADFLLVGTLYATASHPGRPGSGPEAVAALRGRGAPLIGIGGVTPERVAEVRGAGAAGVAVIRGVWDAADPAAAVRRYLHAWRESE